MRVRLVWTSGYNGEGISIEREYIVTATAGKEANIRIPNLGPYCTVFLGQVGTNTVGEVSATLSNRTATSQYQTVDNVLLHSNVAYAALEVREFAVPEIYGGPVTATLNNQAGASRCIIEAIGVTGARVVVGGFPCPAERDVESQSIEVPPLPLYVIVTNGAAPQNNEIVLHSSQ